MAKSSEFENRMAQRRSRREKKQKRSWILKGVAGAFLLYLILLVIFSFRGGITTMIAMNGVVQEEIMTDGYVFRQQEVVKAPVAGFLECLVNDGERVQEGQKIGVIHMGEYDTERAGKIRSLTERIARLEESSADTIYTGDNVMTEQRISLLARDLSDMRKKHDMSVLSEGKESIDVLIEQKNAIGQDGGTSRDDLLTSLKRELRELQMNEENGFRDLYAGSLGVFCSRIDGMESELTMEKAKNITVGKLEELDSKSLERKTSVEAGDAACKVVNNYGWCYATCISEKDAEHIKVGSEIKMRFFELSDNTITGTVQSISEPEKGKVAMVIYTNRYVDGIYGISRASAEIIRASAEGIKVPVESLHVKKGQPGIYVLRLGVARFVPIKLLYRNETWAVISAVTGTGAEYQLKIYDEVIVSGKNLEDGKVVR